jgi:hypothetical protein
LQQLAVPSIGTFLCLTEEDSGMLMSSVFIVITYVGGKEGRREQWRFGKGTKNGAVDSEHGASGHQGQRIAATYKEPPFQVRGLFIH